MKKLYAVSSQTCSMPVTRNSREYFEMYCDVIANLPHGSIEQAIDELLRAYESGGRIFLLGNGGSAALASHFACDLGKGTVIENNGQKRFRVMALTDNVPMITAWANDSGYDRIFAEQLQNFVAPGDIVFAVSGSGNSPNVLRALDTARDARATTIGLTGFSGGKMRSLCDVCIILPSDNMQIIEDFHLSVAHAIFSVIRHRLSDRIGIQSLAATSATE
jgi:D-sedoheptulose 7-phosphate isomerase